jgi:uncharacterized iron-regulated protein
MKLTLLCLLLALPILVLSQANYKVYNTATQKQVSLDDIINDMTKADVVFYGEEHNDSVGHTLELALFSKLIQKFPKKAALSLEMFETDTQPILNEYLRGLIREKNLISDARAWPNYKDYRPLVELAKEKGVSVIAANAPGRYTNRVTRLGLNSLQQLDATAKSWLPPLPIDTATGAYYQKFVDIMGGHAGMGGMQIYQSQNLWDATMGYSIAQFYKAHEGFKIFQVNGSFHSEEKLGIVAQLQKYAPGVKVINIQAYADDSFSNPDWSKFAKLGDYIILTDPKLPKTF